MRITPLDVRKQEFKKVVRGLDPEEVYAFLATLADEYETVLTDNKHLREKVLELDEKVSEYRNMEKTLRDTLLTAERVMADAKENARKEGDVIVREAKIEAERETAQIHARVEGLWAQLRQLRAQRDAFLARLRGLAQAQLGLADSYARDFAADENNTEVRVRGGIPAPPAPVDPQESDYQYEAPAYATAPAGGPAPEEQEAEPRAEASRYDAPPGGRGHDGDAWRDYSPQTPRTSESRTSEPRRTPEPARTPAPSRTSESFQAPSGSPAAIDVATAPIPPAGPKPSAVYHSEEAPSRDESPLTHLPESLSSTESHAAPDPSPVYPEADTFQPEVPTGVPAPPVDTRVEDGDESPLSPATSVRIADIVSRMDGPPQNPLGLDGKGAGGHSTESVATWPASGEDSGDGRSWPESPSSDAEHGADSSRESSWSMDNFNEGLGKL